MTTEIDPKMLATLRAAARDEDRRQTRRTLRVVFIWIPLVLVGLVLALVGLAAIGIYPLSYVAGGANNR